MFIAITVMIEVVVQPVVINVFVVKSITKIPFAAGVNAAAEEAAFGDLPPR
jgi:hypothetical protein